MGAAAEGVRDLLGGRRSVDADAGTASEEGQRGGQILQARGAERERGEALLDDDLARGDPVRQGVGHLDEQPLPAERLGEFVGACRHAAHHGR